MWLVIDPQQTNELGKGAVVGTSAHEPPEGAFKPPLILKEWFGPEPPVHDPSEGIFSYDPTIDDVGGFRADAKGLKQKVEEEIQWLNTTIPTIDNLVVKRLARQNLAMIKALRYIVMKLER